MKDFGIFLDMRRCKNWTKNLLKISKYLKTCLASFSQSTECLIPDFHPEHLLWVLKVSNCSGHDLIFVEADGKCLFLVGRATSWS